MKQKVCKDCGRLRAVSEFYVKRVNSNGKRYYARCKTCYNKWTYIRHGREYVKDGEAFKRRQARDDLKKAVKSGRIKKPTTCSSCGRYLPPEKLEGHHENGYGNPFDVVFLCRTCHVLRHKPPLPGQLA